MPRNKELMRIFRDVDLVEQLGSGMSRILRVYNKSVFKISEHFIKVVFPFNESNLDKNTASGSKNGSKVGNKNGSNNEELKIKEIMRTRPEIMVNELSELLGLSSRKTSRIIRILRESGQITRLGSTRNGTWSVND